MLFRPASLLLPAVIALCGCQTDKTQIHPVTRGAFDKTGFMAVIDEAAAAMGSVAQAQTIHSADGIMLPDAMQHVGIIIDTSGSMRANQTDEFNAKVGRVLQRVGEMAGGADRVWFLDSDGRALIGGIEGIPGGGVAAHVKALESVSADLVYSGSDPTLAIIAALRHFHSLYAATGGTLDLVVVSDALVVRDAMPLERLMSIGGIAARAPMATEQKRPGGIQARVHFVQLPVKVEGSDDAPTAEALQVYSELVAHKFHGFSYRLAQP